MFMTFGKRIWQCKHFYNLIRVQECPKMLVPNQPQEPIWMISLYHGKYKHVLLRALVRDTPISMNLINIPRVVNEPKLL